MKFVFVFFFLSFFLTNYRILGYPMAPTFTALVVNFKSVLFIMSRVSNRVRNSATASGARADAPPVLSSKWTAGNVKSEQGPQTRYRIRGSRCAPSAGGGVNLKNADVLINGESPSLLSDLPPSKGSDRLSEMEPCQYCGKPFKKVRGMARHLKSCSDKKLYDKANEQSSAEPVEDVLPVFCMKCGLKFMCPSMLKSHTKVWSKTSLSKKSFMTPCSEVSIKTSLSKVSSQTYNIGVKGTRYGSGMLKYREYKRDWVNQSRENTTSIPVSSNTYMESLPSINSAPNIDLPSDISSIRESPCNNKNGLSLNKESLASSDSAPLVNLLPDLSDFSLTETINSMVDATVSTITVESQSTEGCSSTAAQSPVSEEKTFCPRCRQIFDNPAELKPHILVCRNKHQGMTNHDLKSSTIDFQVESPTSSTGAPGIATNSSSKGTGSLDRECKVVLEDVLEIKARKKGGEIVQGYQCYPCRKVFTCYRGLEVHRRGHPECTNYTFQCEVCTRFFKNEKGLLQHQERYDCGPASITFATASNQGVSSGCQQSVDCNDQRLAGLDSHHIAHSERDFEAERSKLEILPGKARIKWPKMSNEKAWKLLDSKATKQLLTEGSIEGRIKVLEEVIYEEAKDLFGCQENVVGGKERTFSRREKKLREIRHQIRHLTKMARNCDDDDEKGGILLARQDLMDRRRELRQAENKRKQRWRRKNVRNKFYDDPYRTCKELLSDNKSVPLKVDTTTINAYVKEVASDPLREVDLGSLPGLPDAPLPSIPFDESKFRFSDFKYILRKTRNASRPGHNQIPYKVYKKCPELAKYLFGLFISVLKSGSTPLSWRISDGIFLPKVTTPVETNINDYRQIALLNVEDKLYWALVAKRLYA